VNQKTKALFFVPYFLFLGRALDYAGHLASFWAHVNLPYRIVSYRLLRVSTTSAWK